MGNQGTSSGEFRKAVELIRAGALGQIKEVIVWNSGGGAAKKAAPKDSQPVPGHFKWDIWLGPASERDYHTDWTKWHEWRDFGTGQLGNWGSHSANLAFMALKVDTLWYAKSGAELREDRGSANCSGRGFPNGGQARSNTCRQGYLIGYWPSTGVVCEGVFLSIEKAKRRDRSDEHLSLNARTHSCCVRG